MKVLHISAAYKPAFIYGGPTRSVAKLCEEQTHGKLDVNVLTTNANGRTNLKTETGKWLDVDGVRVMYCKRWIGDHIQFSPGLLRKVFRVCRSYDVVHVHSWWNLTSVLSAMACLLHGITPVVSLRGTLSDYSFRKGRSLTKRLLHRMIGRRLLSKSVLHATSAKEQAECFRVLGDVRLQVIPNILDLPDQSLGGPRSEDKYILFVGRIHPVKNLELLLDGMQLANDPTMTLKVIGHGDTDYVEMLKEKARSAGSSVEWMGAMDGEPKFRTIAQAQALVLTSLTENFGNVVVEALSQGTPVIVTKSTGICSFVAEHNFGWVIDNDPAEVVWALEELKTDMSKVTRIRATARSVVEVHLGRDHLMKQYLELYRNAGTLGKRQSTAELKSANPSA